MHTVFALLCFVLVIHRLIFPYPSGLLHWHCGNLTIAPVPAKQPWWIWINTSCEFIMNDYITTTKQSTTKPCAYFSGYTVSSGILFLDAMGWVGLWGFLWWAPSAKKKDHHGVSSGWSNVWHRSNTGLSSTQYQQIPIILGVWPFFGWLSSFFRSITFWRAYG